ncbi:MAG: PspA/IM30 family protein [Acidobacteria bacterium]|nr:PspA/IM30 family protein [Acidobacteriota bacterium]
MALLERVSTLIRANINDLIDKAEDPEKMIKQVMLDMENQLIQVKTQMAVALADRHLLEKKRKEAEAKAAEWMQKAELAIDKGDDALARAALERSLDQQNTANSLKAQEAEQNAQAETLKSSLKILGEKLAEAQKRKDLLIAQHRRNRVLHAVGETQSTVPGEKTKHAAPDPLKEGLTRSEAMSRIKADLVPDDLEQKFSTLEKEDQVNRLLAEIKARRQTKA